MLIIDWTREEKRHAPCASNPNRRDTFVPVRCGECDGEEYWLRVHDARKGSCCANCQRRQRAQKGYQAAVDKYGREAILRKLAVSLAENPSWAEIVVFGMLDQMGAEYSISQVRQIDGAWYIIDIVLPGERYVEVNGWGHGLPNRAARDQRLTGAGFDVLFITTKELRTDVDAVFARLQEYAGL